MKVSIEFESEEEFRNYFDVKTGISPETHRNPSKSRDSEEKVLFPKMYGKAEETVLKILQHDDTGLTPVQMMKYTDMGETSIKPVLYKLLKEGKVEKSTTSPIKWYTKGNNTDVKELLKNVKRRGNKID